jgi:segregation and condensation protein B
MVMTQEKILEAALFMSARPLMLDELGKILGVNSLGYVKELLEKLQKDYALRGMDIVNTPQGWTMQVKPELLSKVAHLTPYSDISEGSKRALAIIAYKEPVQQSEIIKIQGNKAYSYLKDLRKRNLINMEKKGRTKQITLTGEFERYFGEEKEKIKERLESSQKRREAKAEKAGKKAPKTGALDAFMPASGESKAEAKEKSKEGKKSKEKKPEPEQAKELPKEESAKPPKKSDIDHILD